MCVGKGEEFDRTLYLPFGLSLSLSLCVHAVCFAVCEYDLHDTTAGRNPHKFIAIDTLRRLNPGLACHNFTAMP